MGAPSSRFHHRQQIAQLLAFRLFLIAFCHDTHRKMAEAAEDLEDFVQQSETAETPNLAAGSSASASEAKQSTSKKRNAFAELMAPKPKAPKSESDTKSSKKPEGWRGALLGYIQHPDRYSQVVRATENTVLIKDSFPKATVHLLLLPRSPKHYGLRPHGMVPWSCDVGPPDL